MRLMLGKALLTALPLLTIAAETRASGTHLVDGEWPAHALFHTAIGLVYLQLLAGMVLWLVWRRLGPGEDWAWWAIGLIGSAIHGAHLVGEVLTGGGLTATATVNLTGPAILAISTGFLAAYWVGLALVRPCLEAP